MKHHFASISVLVALTLVMFAGCAPKPLHRELPTSIRYIYVPMFETHAYEPGLEEELTRKTIDEFLVDGRVQIARPQQADIILTGFLKEYIVEPEDWTEDEFALTETVTATARMVAYGPDDIKRETPLFVWDNIEVDFSYVSDKRFTVDTLDVDARRMLMRDLAREIVNRVMMTAADFDYRMDEELQPELMDMSPRYRTSESLRERRKRDRGVPTLRHGF